MKIEVIAKDHRLVIKQRNLLLGFGIIMLACNCFLGIKIILTQERIIMVPGLNKEAWITGHGVDNSYLEEVTAMYLPMLLDLDENSIEWKRDRLFNYVSHSDPKYIKELHDYFARVKEHYSHFSLSTHFALKKFESNPKDLTVVAHGLLVKHFGNRGSQADSADYLLELEWQNGKLLLKQFKKLSKEDLNE